MNKSAFEDAQSLALIGYLSDVKAVRESFWASAMKSLKEAYGVK